MAQENKKSIYRAIDANLNRAVEGLRVVEDVMRFFRDDAKLSASLRAARHELRAAAEQLPGGNAALVSARDSRGDVARNAPPATKRTDIETVVSANLKRAQEAARALEEYSKVISRAASEKFGEIRFRIYDLEKDIIHAAARLRSDSPKMPSGRFIYAIADFPTLSARGSFKFASTLISSGVGIVQLREKHFSDSTILARVRSAAARFAGTSTLFCVNDRADIALAAGASVLHLGQDDLPIQEAREISGGKLLIGLSSHSSKQASAALKTAPDYLSVGPIFSSLTKPENKPVGLKLLERVAGVAGGTPVVAIGGITPENIREVFAAGASGVAMITSLSLSGNLEKTLKNLNGVIAEFNGEASSWKP